MAKSLEQVHREFRAAASPAAWLQGELADFFAEGVDDPDDREVVVEKVAASADRTLERWAASQLQGDELSEFRLIIVSPAGDGTYSVFRALPSPMALLEVCSATCAEGDHVVIEQRYANGIEIRLQTLWPFGMDEAVRLSSPHQELAAAPETVAALQQQEPPEIPTPATASLPPWLRRTLAGTAALLLTGLVSSRRARS